MTTRNKILRGIAAVLAAVMLCSCSQNTDNDSGSTSDNTGSSDGSSSDSSVVSVDYKYEQELNIIDDNYRNYYEIFVYSFCDTNGDGIGDLKGVTSKLDYIQEMGYNGIWLMPIMPSTTYHKYDVTDYYGIDPQYGTMDDFDELVSECNKRGIKLLIDLVMNHSSAKHPWFTEMRNALNNPECGAAADAECQSANGACPTHCKYVNYYNISKESKTKYHQLNSEYYYECQFWDQMPDLNLENEDVRREFENIAKFWLDKGVGGFRLDAVKEFVSGNIDKNVEILKWFVDYCKSVDPDCYLVGEAWDGFSTYVKYYDSGIPSVFGYAVGTQSGTISKTIINSSLGVKQFAENMVTIESALEKRNPEAIDAPFISNHDNGRDSGFLRYDKEKIKAAAGLLLTMSGSPFVYYGQEIGLTGSGDKDENYRAPMIWDSEGAGKTNGPENMNPQDNRFPSVEEQQADPNSILNYYKRAVRIRNENPVIARGKTVVLDVDGGNDYAAIERTYNGDTITIVYNYSAEEHEFTDAALNLSSKQIRGYLTVSSAQDVTLDNGVLKIPPYGIAFLV